MCTHSRAARLIPPPATLPALLSTVLLLVGAGCSSKYALVEESGSYLDAGLTPSVSEAILSDGARTGPLGERIGTFGLVLSENVEGNRRHVWESQKTALIAEMTEEAAALAADRGATHMVVTDVSRRDTVMASYDRTPRFFSNRWQEQAKVRAQRPVPCFYPKIEVILYRTADPEPGGTE